MVVGHHTPHTRTHTPPLPPHARNTPPAKSRISDSKHKKHPFGHALGGTLRNETVYSTCYCKWSEYRTKKNIAIQVFLLGLHCSDPTVIQSKVDNRKLLSIGNLLIERSCRMYPILLKQMFQLDLLKMSQSLRLNSLKILSLTKSLLYISKFPSN